MAVDKKHEVFTRRYNWKHQHTHLEVENEPYIDMMQRIGAVETLLRIFMQVGEDSPECSHQFAEMDALCPEVHLQDLKLDRSDQIPMGAAAWLDERRYGKKKIRRPYPRILNVRELYRALKRKVSRDNPGDSMRWP